jgi:hypothetical protein
MVGAVDFDSQTRDSHPSANAWIVSTSVSLVDRRVFF